MINCGPRSSAGGAEIKRDPEEIVQALAENGLTAQQLSLVVELVAAIRRMNWAARPAVMTISTEFLVRRLNALGLHGEALYAELGRFDAANAAHLGARPQPPIRATQILGETLQDRKRRLAAARQRLRRENLRIRAAACTVVSGAAEAVPVTQESHAPVTPCHAPSVTCHAPFSLSSSFSVSDEIIRENKEEATESESSARELGHAHRPACHAEQPKPRSPARSGAHRHGATLGMRQSIDPNWLPSEQDRLTATEIARWDTNKVDDEVLRFLDHHRINGTTSADWSASWRKWCRDAVAYEARKAPAQVVAFAAGLNSNVTRMPIGGRRGGSIAQAADNLLAEFGYAENAAWHAPGARQAFPRALASCESG